MFTKVYQQFRRKPEVVLASNRPASAKEPLDPGLNIALNLMHKNAIHFKRPQTGNAKNQQSKSMFKKRHQSVQPCLNKFGKSTQKDNYMQQMQRSK